MITAEEKTRERFPDRSNRDNTDKQNHRNRDIRKENVDRTTPWQWLTNQRSFPNPEDMMTSKTYVAHCTLMGSTPSEIATPSMINTQEKIVRGTLKKTIRKKMRTTTKTRDSKNLGEQ